MFKLQRHHSRQSHSLVMGRIRSRAYMQRGGNQFGDDRLGLLALLRQNQRTPEVRRRFHMSSVASETLRCIYAASDMGCDCRVCLLLTLTR
jgi:hypothetical protein